MASSDALDASPLQAPAQDNQITGLGAGHAIAPPLSAIIDVLPLPARLSTRTGECLRVNQAWLVNTGTSVEQTIGTGWLNAVHPGDRHVALASFDQPNELSAAGIARSFRLRMSNGAYSVIREHDVRSQNALDVSVLSIGSISESILDSHELQSWGHELRGTLNTIVGWTELVHSGLLSQEESLNGVQAIRRAAHQHAETIANLLDSVRLREDLATRDAASVSLGDVLTRAIKGLPPEIDRARIKLELHDKDVWIALDGTCAPRAFAQILQTIVAASPPSIVLTVRAYSQADFVHIRIEEDSSSRSERVIEELPAGALGRYMTRLAYARSLICGSGGRIEISRAGEVLVFNASVPRGVATAVEAVADLSTLRGMRILLVDDDADARAIGGQMLTAFGAQVTTASSAREARDILVQEPIVDVLVSDIAMPEEDGYDLLRGIRSMSGGPARIPAVALTSFSGPSTEQRARIVGYQRCVFKPTDANILATAIHEAWRDSRS
jgi:CheY-like chemotaxis protein